MKCRVIWIDDERDPEMYVPGLGPRWLLRVPVDFAVMAQKPENSVEIVWLKSYREWLDWVIDVWHDEPEEEYVNCFCLDHDLASFEDGGREQTGVDVAYDIIEECIMNSRALPFYECHSSNPPGKEDIISVFESYRKVYEIR